jgi:hypothetical protein
MGGFAGVVGQCCGGDAPYRRNSLTKFA